MPFPHVPSGILWRPSPGLELSAVATIVVATALTAVVGGMILVIVVVVSVAVAGAAGPSVSSS